MPFIDCKISKKVTDEQKDALKAEMGKSIGIMHKPESYLMVGIVDDYTLYLAGKKLPEGAFVGISVLGSVSSSDAEKMTAAVCDALKKVLGIPGENVYVTYQGIRDWGHDGYNF